MKKGFTLIELLASLGVASSMALIQISEDKIQDEQLRGSAMGSEIRQFNSAVSRFLSDHANSPEDSIGVSASSPVTFTGSNWLKSILCAGGTANKDYLNCDLLPNGVTSHFHSEPVTTVQLTSSGRLSARTVWSPAIGDNGRENTTAMGVAAMVAGNSYSSQADVTDPTYTPPTVYCPDLTSFTSEISAICQSDSNRIISQSNGDNSLEPWLRTDHTNTMVEPLEFAASPSSQGQIDAIDNGASSGSWIGSGMRQIINVARLYNRGSTGNDSMIIGSQNGDSLYTDAFITSNGLLQNATIIDGSLAVTGDAYIKENLNVEGDAQVSGTTHADNRITGQGSATATGNITSLSGDIIAHNGPAIARTVRSNNNITIDGNSFSQRHYDIDNNSYYIDASSRSRVNDITAYGDMRAPIYYDQNDTSYYANPSSRSYLRHLTANGDVRAAIYYDQNNTGYYGNFSGGSRFNKIDANSIVSRGRITAQEYFHLNKSVSVGASCSPNGLLSRISSGEVASCVNGRWKSGGQGFTNQNGTRLTSMQTYTNNSGGPMYLTLKARIWPSNDVSIFVDGIEVAKNYLVDVSSGNIRERMWWTLSTIVPNGSTYSINAQNASTYTTTRTY